MQVDGVSEINDSILFLVPVKAKNVFKRNSTLTSCKDAGFVLPHPIPEKWSEIVQFSKGKRRGLAEKKLLANETHIQK